MDTDKECDESRIDNGEAEGFIDDDEKSQSVVPFVGLPETAKVPSSSLEGADGIGVDSSKADAPKGAVNPTPTTSQHAVLAPSATMPSADVLSNATTVFESTTPSDSLLSRIKNVPQNAINESSEVANGIGTAAAAPSAARLEAAAIAHEAERGAEQTVSSTLKAGAVPEVPSKSSISQTAARPKEALLSSLDKKSTQNTVNESIEGCAGIENEATVQNGGRLAAAAAGLAAERAMCTASTSGPSYVGPSSLVPAFLRAFDGKAQLNAVNRLHHDIDPFTHQDISPLPSVVSEVPSQPGAFACLGVGGCSVARTGSSMDGVSQEFSQSDYHGRPQEHPANATNVAQQEQSPADPTAAMEGTSSNSCDDPPSPNVGAIEVNERSNSPGLPIAAELAEDHEMARLQVRLKQGWS
jgi:hypothetical protein